MGKYEFLESGLQYVQYCTIYFDESSIYWYSPRTWWCEHEVLLWSFLGTLSLGVDHIKDPPLPWISTYLKWQDWISLGFFNIGVFTIFDNTKNIYMLFEDERESSSSLAKRWGAFSERPEAWGQNLTLGIHHNPLLKSRWNQLSHSHFQGVRNTTAGHVSTSRGAAPRVAFFSPTRNKDPKLEDIVGALYFGIWLPHVATGRGKSSNNLGFPSHVQYTKRYFRSTR